MGRATLISGMSRKTAAIQATLVAVAVTGAVVSLLYARATALEVDALMAENIGDMLAASELDVALLRQRGFVASYMIAEGDESYLRELDRREPIFRRFLARAEKALEVEGEQALLARTKAAFEDYDAKRADVVRLRRAGDVEAAKALLLREVNAAYVEVAVLCDQIVKLSSVQLEEALAEGRGRLSRLAWVVAASCALTIALGAAAGWFVFRGVFVPLRHMAEDAASFPMTASPDQDAVQEGDVRALGRYLKALMTEVTKARSDVAQSRRERDQSERLAAIGNAVAHLAHEIRNRLTLIGGYAHLIEKRSSGDAGAGENAQVIFREVRRLELMLEEVMEFSKPVRIEAKVQSINALVQAVAGEVGTGIPEGVTLEVRTDPATPDVPFDGGRMEHVLINLLRNALDAVGERGTITITTTARGGGATVVVRDDGPGIPAEIVERLFEPFFTTKRRGSGLGLAICRRIVGELGGTIVVESTPGKGAAFTAELPGAGA